jgi:hypothetical protein
MLTIFRSQPSLLEGTTCVDSSKIDRGCRDAHTITPQSCERVDTSYEHEQLQHAKTHNSSQYTVDRIADLKESANVLLSRERSSATTYFVHLNNEELACRKKMIDWAMRVLGFGCSTTSSSDSKSIQAISIVVIAFS